MGTQNLKKVPMETRVPKWGPTWEQCISQRLIVRSDHLASIKLSLIYKSFHQFRKCNWPLPVYIINVLVVWLQDDIILIRSLNKNTERNEDLVDKRNKSKLIQMFNQHKE